MESNIRESIQENKIELTFGAAPEPAAARQTASTEEKREVTRQEKADVQEKTEAPGYMTDVQLTPEEKAQVAELAEKIDLADVDAIMNYGAASQQKIASFSDDTLQQVKTKDLGETGEMITNLIVELKNDPSEEKGFLGLFKKNTSLEKLKTRYTGTEKNVDRISEVLEGHRNQLTKDVVLFDELYSTNLVYYKELTMYIMAGKQALEKEKTEVLAALQAKAKETGLAEDAQAAADHEALITRFEKKLYDLELTRSISMQMAPQIRLMQNNDVVMAEKIHSTLVNTIPLWKNQLVLSLGLAHSREALSAERAVTQMTNELLKKNAETLKLGTVEIAKEGERGIVDIETLKETSQKLAESLTEVARIQSEGRAKRAEAEKELALIEAELKTKLLELSGDQGAAKQNNV